MRKSIVMRLRTCVISVNMFASVFVGIILLLWFFVKNIILYNIHIGPLSIFNLDDIYLNSILESHARSGFDLFAPILAVLPASTIYCDDYNSGYIKSILIRKNRTQYAHETFICSTFAGGLAVFIPSFFTGLFYMIIGKPNLPENVLPGFSSLLSETAYSGIEFIWGGGLVFLLLMVLAFLFGAVWSNIGLCISVFAPNRYIALAAPFAIYFALHILLYRTGTLLLYSPVNMVTADAAFIPSILFPFAYQITLLLSSLEIYRAAILRRLNNV